MRSLTTIAVLLGLLITGTAFGQLSRAEQAALSKYDHLEDSWRQKAVKAWKIAKNAPGKNTATAKRLLKNDPPYYPPMYEASVAIDGLSLNVGDWGHLNQMVNIMPGLYVVKILDEQTILARAGGTEFVVEIGDTSQVSAGSVNLIPGAYHVDGSTMRIGSDALPVLKPLPVAPKK